MKRRCFLETTLPLLAAWSLIGKAAALDAMQGPVRPLALAWLREVAAACNGMRTRALSQTAWQDAMAALFARVPLTDLLVSVEFPALAERLSLPDDRAGVIDPQLPDIEGLPRRRDCLLRVFGMARGRAIVPHGHANMASAHLVVQGRMHVRHYQRIEDRDEGIVLSPSIDLHAQPGDATTVSDQRDNVHWLVAESAAAYTLDFIVLDLDPGRTTRWFDFVDIEGAQPLQDGSLLAPRLDFATAIGIYGGGGRTS
jgi:hypothetical protein